MFYRYRREGRPIQLTIGDYPSISLSQARERRQQFRLWLSKGYDPRRQVVLSRLKNVRQ
ncbi:Arm DNA-binding domain-containing protein [Pantoea brenneri]|uniref:Arm DNA-binding domain-containing protein n=1 Tax=Pantoea brenneri TaxID=472694 RepID=UPI00289CFFF3|nr:Arm DNA-binding domain-containing protein [Pantoea brenneri]